MCPCTSTHRQTLATTHLELRQGERAGRIGIRLLEHAGEELLKLRTRQPAAAGSHLSRRGGLRLRQQLGEVRRTELIDVSGLRAQHLASEGLEHARKLLGHAELFTVLGRHRAPVKRQPGTETVTREARRGCQVPSERLIQGELQPGADLLDSKGPHYSSCNNANKKTGVEVRSRSARKLGAMDAAIGRSRSACASQPGLAEAVQLNATGKLAISCQPPENDGVSAPCIHEAFFNFPWGFERMSNEDMAYHAFWRRIDPFNQCRRRTRDADWPTVEVTLQRTAETKTMKDVMNVLGRRVVTLVGASVMRATFGALQCALESAGLRREHELQWTRWGWGTFTDDNVGCNPGLGALRRQYLQGRKRDPAAFVRELRSADCLSRGIAFQKMLNRTDVVVMAYNIQHYEGILDWWKLDLEGFLPALEEFAQRDGKVAILRETSAQHFPGGQYDGERNEMVSERRGCCVQLSEGEAYNNVNW